MKLSSRQKVIIWVTVIFVVLFVGLKTEYTPGGFHLPKYLSLYSLTLIGPHYLGPFYDLITLGDYRSALIVSTILIGLTAFFTFGKKRKP
jgi:hypothetical protein